MRLLSLTIENITSLKGRHHIDFETLSTHSDIFAITGPTGSGKSSILTAISLALYGRSVKSNLAAQDYVTTGSPFAHIELIFSLGRGRYQATWHCQLLKKNGEVRAKPKVLRLLTDLDSHQECTIEDLIDLDFPQFNKVAILNQGKFADFLHASFTERKELLEAILNDQTFLLLGKTLKSDRQQVESDIEKLSLQTTNTQLLDGASEVALAKQVEELDHQLPLHQEFLQGYQSMANTINQVIHHQQQEQTIAEKIERYQKEVAQTAHHLAHHKEREQRSKEDKLKQSALFAQEKGELEQALILQRQLQELEDQVQSLEQRLREHKKSQRDDQQLLAQDQQEQRQNSQALEELSPHTTAYLEEQRVHLLEQFEELLTTLQRELNLAEQEQQLTQRREEYRRRLDKYQVTREQQRPPQLNPHHTEQEILALLQGQTKALGELNQQEKEQLALQRECKQIAHQLKQAREQIAANQLHQQEVAERLARSEQERRPLQDLLHLHSQLRQNLHQYQLILKQREGEAHCPICDHSIDPAKHQSIHQQVLLYQEQADAMERAEARLQELQEVIYKEQQQAETAKQQGQALEEKQLQLEQQQGQIKATLKQLDLKLAPIKQQQEALKATEKYLTTYQLTHQQERQARGEQQTLESQQLKLSADQHQLRERQQSLRQELEAAYHHLLTDDSELAYYRQQLDKLKKEHHEHIRLKQREHELLTRMERTHQHLKKVEQSLEDDRQQKQIRLSQVKEKKELYQAKHYPEHPQQVLADKQAKLEKSERSYQKIHHEYRNQELAHQKVQSVLRTLKEQINDSHNIYLGYQADLHHKLASLTEHETTLPLIQTSFDHQLYHKVSLWLDQDEMKRKESLPALESLYRDKVVPWLTQAQEDLHRHHHDAIVARTRLADHRKQQEKVAQLLERQKLLAGQLHDLRELEFYIGKDQFRDYALSVLEKALLDLANQEISQLADGRYHIVHGKEGKRSEFLIRDEWLGRSLRKVSTLSGGETFMLSLGLSLALSGLNQGDQEVGFFLIDEGFGSLDEESIDEVLECLMNLRSRGKQIGLISHVQSLTERIPATIELEKNHFGESHITLHC